MNSGCDENGNLVTTDSFIEDLEYILGDKAISTMLEYRVRIDNAIEDAALGTSQELNPTDIVANLGLFFKETAYVYQTETVDEETGTTEKITGWRPSKVSVTGALLYGIFIFQSCIYLIMYVKRLFYVIMLAMFGPIVVIYDFFIKSAS